MLGLLNEYEDGALVVSNTSMYDEWYLNVFYKQRSDWILERSTTRDLFFLFQLRLLVCRLHYIYFCCIITPFKRVTITCIVSNLPFHQQRFVPFHCRSVQFSSAQTKLIARLKLSSNDYGFLFDALTILTYGSVVSISCRPSPRRPVFQPVSPSI